MNDTSTIWYLVNAGKTAEKKMDEWEPPKYDDWDYDMFGDPPYHWTESAMGAMGIMTVMAFEFMCCVALDSIILAAIIMII